MGCFIEATKWARITNLRYRNRGIGLFYWSCSQSKRARITNPRPQITTALKTLNKEIDNSVAFVKGYLAEKYKKDPSLSYYPAFGINYENKKYAIPMDQSNREDALDLMLEGIQNNGFEDRTYGLEYWTAIKTNFVDLVTQARALDGGISQKVGDKNELKMTIKKGLNAVINALQANYPDTYKQELRLWGLQKDKY